MGITEIIGGGAFLRARNRRTPGQRTKDWIQRGIFVTVNVSPVLSSEGPGIGIDG